MHTRIQTLLARLHTLESERQSAAREAAHREASALAARLLRDQIYEEGPRRSGRRADRVVNYAEMGDTPRSRRGDGGDEYAGNGTCACLL